MDGQELIQVDLRLPASALDSLSRLAEQLRKLTAAVNGLGQLGGETEELVENGSFDPERFMELRQKFEEANGHIPRERLKEAKQVQPEMSTQVSEAKSAGREISAEPEEAEPAVPVSHDEVSDPEPPAQTRDSSTEQEDIPAVRAAVEEDITEAPAVRMEPDSQIPEAEAVWTPAEEREVPLPAAQAEGMTGVETPLGAGRVVTAQPEAPVSRWTDVTEELVTAGPAPLTAEAVSLAFQRDGRRYDNGFPLY